MDSKKCEVSGTQKQKHQKQKHQRKEHEQRSTRNDVKGGNLKKGQVQPADQAKKKRHADPEHCFLGSSLYYGGPDEHYDTVQTKIFQDEQQQIKVEVKQLEEAMDPFNLEYATRGNWWKGSLYY